MVGNSLDNEQFSKTLQKLNLHIQKSPLAVIDWDTSFCVTGWNPAAEIIFGFPVKEALGKHASFIIPETYHEHVDFVWAELLKNKGGTRSTNENITKDGRIISCEWYNTPITDKFGNILTVASLVQDVTEQVKYLKALQYQAHHDNLTTLHNRGWLTEFINSSIKATPGQAFFLFLIDLDRFKEINDTLGHNVGDAMLITLSQRLKESIDEGNNKVARLGGDEFAVLTYDVDIAEMANRIVQVLEKPIEISGMKLRLSAGIGISCYPPHGNNAASLMRCADIAMYEAKETNSRYMTYSVDIDNHSTDRLMLMSDLRNAINNNQLLLHFQPKIDIREYKHIGYEALLRWKHPQRGLIPPDEFIPYAEITDLIHPLTVWVIENSLIQSVEWSKQGLIHNISINLSARNLLGDSLPNQLALLFNTYGVEPSSIELEITESALMKEPESALRNLNRLHELGVQISIDDFGTGYSSLSYLRQMPIHKLKIDKTFVLDMASNHGDRVIVESTIDLAHNLGLKVVAEGVENKEALALLDDLGCDEAQGNYISRPHLADKLEDWILK
jgi:diguanylate cyclase (GGDEF)-like protein/PAS domain S-box-containing protein